MSDPINLSKPRRPIRAGVILVNSETEILDVAPLDIFNAIRTEFVNRFPESMVTPEMRAQALDFEFHWVNETGKEARLTPGLHVNPTDSFATCPQLDIIVMGAHEHGYHLSDAEKAFIRKSYDNCAAFITICGGMQAALEAGLLEGKTATAPRPMVEIFRQAAPGVKWVEKRWARDDKLWTSGALLNGTDLMRAFVTEYWKGALVDFALEIGHYPIRDVDYADAPGQM